MSSRALRKLAASREIEEFVKEYGSEDEPVKPKQSIFSLIDLPEVDPRDNIHDSDVNSERVDSPSPLSISKRSKKRKNKKSTQKSNTRSATTDDDILLNTYDQQQPSCSAPPVSTLTPKASDLLAVKRKFLDYYAELARKFGATVAIAPPNHASLPFGQLVRQQTDWPPVTKFGIEMQPDDGEFNYTLVFSREYRKKQVAFYALQDLLDPQTLSVVLSKSPYHIDSLLQLSDALIRQNQSEDGIDFLERALFAYQSILHVGFSFASPDSCRMDYRRQENRSFFIALFRYTFCLVRRCCYRSALEYSKALLLLDPDHDPLGISLALDYLAISSEEYEFLIDFYDQFNEKRNLYLLPNFALSLPLARWLQLNTTRKRKRKGEPLPAEEIDKMLQDALILFPGFLPRLMKHVKVGGTDNLDGSFLFGKEVRLNESPILGRMLDLYVSQMRYHWQPPGVVAWLESNVEKVLHLVEPVVVVVTDEDSQIRGQSRAAEPDKRLKEYSEKRKRSFATAPRSVLRYIFLRDLPDVPPYVPPEFAQMHIYPLDPFPPPDGITFADPDAERRGRVAGGGGGGGVVDFVTSLLQAFLPRARADTPDVAAVNEVLEQFGVALVLETDDQSDDVAIDDLPEFD